jgi:chaperonin GroEL
MMTMSKVILLNRVKTNSITTWQKLTNILSKILKTFIGKKTKVKIEDNKAREVMADTVKEFSELVCSTMGPSGQNILLHVGAGYAHITKDGVTVAKGIDYDEPEKKIVAEVLKQAAETTNQAAGDGTTTATCIAAAVVEHGLELINKGRSPTEIKEQLNREKDEILDILKDQRVLFEDKSKEEIKEILYKIAMISTNGANQYAELISDAISEGGINTVISINKGSSKLELERLQGAKIPNTGCVSYEYIRGTKEKKTTLEKCRVLITTFELEDPAIIKTLERNVITPIREAGESLLIISKKADKGFLANMVVLNSTGQLKNTIVRAPYYGAVGREMMDDLAAYVGAQVVDEAAGHKFQSVTINHLGYASRAEVTAFNTTFYGPKTNVSDFEKRVKLLEEKMKSCQDGDGEKVRERYASLTGKVFNLNIPVTSEIENQEELDRVEDAINACRGALEHGYVAGCGVALYEASEYSSKLMKKICRKPFETIISNTGRDPEAIAKARHNAGHTLDNYEPVTYDAKIGCFGEPLKIGIIDSYKVISEAFKNGISVGSTLLTTKGIIANKPIVSMQAPYEMFEG